MVRTKETPATKAQDHILDAQAREGWQAGRLSILISIATDLLKTSDDIKEHHKAAYTALDELRGA